MMIYGEEWAMARLAGQSVSESVGRSVCRAARPDAESECQRQTQHGQHRT